MSREALSDLEKEIRLLDLINDGILPFSTLGSAVSLLAGPLLLFGVAAAGITSITFARRYVRKKKARLLSELEGFRRSGELSEEKYEELKVMLNKLTVEGSETN
jgi:hypothetical protein